MALTTLRGNVIASGTVTDNKLATPFTTGKAIAMSMVFG
tara:strand:+ start:723 stop:839 length:117 start_codon:yes stop_codon:yes gene_type:complete